MLWLTRFLCRGMFVRVLYLICMVLLFSISAYSEVMQSHSSAHAAGGAANFSLQPAIFDPKNPLTQSYFIFNGKVSRFVSSSVRVINTGYIRGSVDLYVVDGETSPTGTIAYRERTAPRHDIGAWTVLSRLHLTLGPGQSQDVPFRLNIPINAGVGQHIGGIVAENATPQIANDRKSSITMNMKKLYAVPIIVNVPGVLREQLLASGVEFDSTSPFQRVLVEFSNTGNVMIRPSGTATISNSRGKVMLIVQMDLQSFLPSTTIQYPLNIMNNALAVGNYQVKIALHYGQYTKGKLDTTFSFQIKKAGKPLATLAVSQALPPGQVNIFSSFSLWQYVLGSAVLLLAGSALFSWAQKLYAVVAHPHHKGEGL